MPYVEVAVNAQDKTIRQTFSYAVPAGMTLTPGDGVLVPFGRRQLQGIVMDVVEVPAFADPKPVDARIGTKPIVSPERVALAKWISSYYLAPLFASVALMLPPGFEQRPLTFYESLVGLDELGSHRLPPRQRLVLEHLTVNGRLESRQLDSELKETGLSASISQLVQRGLISRTYGLDRPGVRAKTVKVVYLKAPGEEIRARIAFLTERRQTRLAKALQVLLDDGPGVGATELRERTGAGPTALKPLLDDNLIEIREEGVERDPLAGRRYQPRPAPPLTQEQSDAFDDVAKSLDARQPASYLLYGVTGSGKTEVYLRALERTIAQGRRGIVLVPEIALTPQTVRRFAERFPGQVAVLHSGLSQGELFDQWHGIAEGRYGVVVGSRSAVFAPIPSLGLIVIDEEHEWTYKQNDPSPRYHARDAATELSKLCNAVLLLGSATPDVISYQKALWGQHKLLELHERVRPVRQAARPAAGTFLGNPTSNGHVQYGANGNGDSARPHPPSTAVEGGGAVAPEGGPPEQVSSNAEHPHVPLDSVGVWSGRVVSSTEMPPVEIVDMRDELKGGNRSIFSRALQLALYQTVERGEQAILFLNRRGSAGFLQCRDCGFVPQCSACAIAMGFHRQGGIEHMMCHQCNRTRGMFERCPMCGSARLRPMGLGVEAVEESAAELLPGLRTLRWDRDVTQGHNSHEQILQSFLDGEADVLIGTQMVAKGLDLPAVTLVGVISADIGLHIPDFRSAERTFQLLTQVAGRAGRTISADGHLEGKVVIQTYTPDNYAILAAADHDYHTFFAHEIELRQAEAYPPFVRLARLVYAHYDADRGQREATRMAKALEDDAAQRGLPGVEVIGPAPPHVPKWHGRTRWQVTVRSPDPAELLRDVKLTEGWVFDIDPASMA